MSVFNNEDKVSWDELAPSLQELFKGLQTAIEKERLDREKAINDLRAELKTYIDQKTSVDQLTPKVKSIVFDEQGRLKFPNNDRFWIG